MAPAAVISLSHGGGPMPVLGDPDHREITESLRTRVPKILKLNTSEAPRAIVVVTAHWSTREPAITSARRPSLLYDYYGFPKESYQFKYDAPGNPEIAEEIAGALKEQGFSPTLNDSRGWDHGVFIPMMLIHEAADIPVVQMSVLKSEDVDQHFRMGLALQKLRNSNVAIIGSGFASLHNLPLMFSGLLGDPGFRGLHEAWNGALVDAAKEDSAAGRRAKFARWRTFPGSEDMHPLGRAEHFMPLLVCAGAGADGTAQTYADKFHGLDMYSIYWE